MTIIFKLIKGVVFFTIALVNSSFAQSNLNLKLQEKEELTAFLERNGIAPENKAIKDYIYSNLRFESILEIGKSNTRSWGIYTLIPLIDPKVEFICLVDDSVIPLPTENLDEDLPRVMEFLEGRLVKITNKELFEVFEKLSNLYKAKRESRESFLPR